MGITSRQSAQESEVYSELSLQLRGALGDGTRLAIGALVAHLREVGRSGNDDSAVCAASALWSNISQRIQSVQDVFAGESERRLATNWSCNNQADAPPVDGAGMQAEPVTRLFAERPRLRAIGHDLGLHIRAADAIAYSAFVAGLRQITCAPWSTEATNPLAAQAIGWAVMAGIEDILDECEVATVLTKDVLVELGRILSMVHVSGAQFLAAAVGAGSGADLPFGYDGGGDEATRQTREMASEQQESMSEGGKAQTSTSGSPGGPFKDPTDHAVRADRDARSLGVSALGRVIEGPDLPIVPTLQPVLDMERDAVAFAHSIDEVPYSRSSRRRYFEGVRARLAQQQTTATQLALVDLVAAMFDYVVDDRRLPQAAKPLIWRLQQPALLLTLLDPAYLGDHERSLRRLVESFGAIANAFGDDFTRGSELYRRLETIVRAVEIISNVLHTRASVLSAQVRKEYERCARNMTQLVERVGRERTSLESTPGRRNRRDYSQRPGRDEERLVTDQLNRSLAEKLSRQPVPESVRRFLEDVWLRYMRSSLLRDGEDSAGFHEASKVLDDLLWTLDRTGPNPARAELAQRIPGLIHSLTRGMREIGAREKDHQAFFDELFLIHLNRLQRRRHTQQPDGARPIRGAGNLVPKILPDATMYDVGQAVPVLDEAMDLDDDQLSETIDTLASTTTDSLGQQFTDSDVSQPSSTISSLTVTAPIESTIAPAASPRDTATDRTRASKARAVNTRRRHDHEELTPLIELPMHPHTDIPSVMVTTQVAAPTTRVATPATQPASNDDTTPDNPMLALLSRTDLGDLPPRPRYLRGDPATLMTDLRAGDWLEYRMGSGKFAYLKLAWINRRRTVLMLLRYPDRRALSKPFSEVQEYLRAGRIRLIKRTSAQRRTGS